MFVNTLRSTCSYLSCTLKQNGMNLDTRTFTIDRIIFESGDDEVMLKGNIKDGVMNYNSDLIISFSQLNFVINQLANNNSNFSIERYLSKEFMYDNLYMYEANLNSVSNSEIDLYAISQHSEIKQIRA